MKKTNFHKIIRTIAIAISLSVLAGGTAMAQESETEKAAQEQPATDFQKMKARIGSLASKASKASKDDMQALFQEASAIRKDIEAAALAADEKEAIKKAFNEAIETCKGVH